LDRSRPRARRVRHVSLAADVGEALNRGGNLETALRRCAEVVVRHLGVAFARIWTIDSSGSVLELRASAGLYTRLDGTYARIPLCDLEMGPIGSQHRPHLTNDVQRDPHIKDPEWARQEGMVALAGYPLVVEGRLLGDFGTFSRQPLSNEDFDALSGVAHALAQGIERYRAEEALRASERRLAEAQRIAQVGSWETDLVQGRTFWSDELYRVFGLEPWEVQWPYAAVLERVHPEDRPGMQRIWDQERAEVGPFEAGFRVVRPDGNVRFVYERGETFADQAGRPLRSAGTVQDITERREAEQALYRREQTFQAIVETTSDCIARWDRDLRCVYANPAIERAWGLPASAFLGKTSREFSLPTEQTDSSTDIWELALRQVFACGREQALEISSRVQEGQRQYQVRLTPEFGPDGSVAFVVTVSRDVTEQRRREDDQARLYRELLEREERLNALVRRALLTREQEQRRHDGDRRLSQLTRREREILDLVAQGLTTREIAERLVLARGTVRNSITVLLNKLGVENRTQAAIRVMELGLLAGHGDGLGRTRGDRS
jgi:PAS domain S-box-containing protein